MYVYGIAITMPIVWLVLLIFFLIVESLTVGLTSIWFAASAFFALLIAAIGGPIWLQVSIFVILSFVFLAFTRKFFVNKLKTGSERTNANVLIGNKALVISKIEPYEGGRVRINGQEWAAIGENPDSSIDENQMVRIIAIEGVKLIVSP